MNKSKVHIMNLRDNILIKKEDENSKFFTSSKTFFLIPVRNFSSLLKFMLFKEIISPKLLEGVLSEYYNRNS